MTINLGDSKFLKENPPSYYTFDSEMAGSPMAGSPKIYDFKSYVPRVIVRASWSSCSGLAG